MAQKKGFIVYNDYLQWISILNDRQCGILFRHMVEYANDNTKSEIQTKDQSVRLAWEVIKATMERDSVKYEESSKQKAIGSILKSLKKGHRIKPENIQLLKEEGCLTRRYLKSKEFDDSLIDEILEEYQDT